MTNLGTLVYLLRNTRLHTHISRGASSTLMQEIAQGSVLLLSPLVLNCSFKTKDIQFVSPRRCSNHRRPYSLAAKPLTRSCLASTVDLWKRKLGNGVKSTRYPTSQIPSAITDHSILGFTITRVSHQTRQRACRRRRAFAHFYPENAQEFPLYRRQG